MFCTDPSKMEPPFVALFLDYTESKKTTKKM